MLLVAVGLTCLFLTTRSESKQAQELPPPLLDTRSQPQEVAYEARTAAITAPESETLQEALSSHWGEQWTNIRSAYLEAGFDLSKPLASSELRPWEEAVPEIQKVARSIFERDQQLIRRTFAFRVEESREEFLARHGLQDDAESAVLLDNLEIELAEIDLQIDVLFDRYQAHLRTLFESALSSTPERYPLLDLREREKRPGDFYRVRVEGGGWFVTYHCNRASRPDLAEIEAERDRLVAQRLQKVKDLVQSRRVAAQFR